MRIVYVPSEMDLCSLNFCINIGSANEEDEYAGIVHLIEHLIFHGHPKYSQNEVMEFFEKRGGMINAYVDFEMTCIFLRIHKKYLKEAIELIYDIIVEFNINEEDIKNEQAIILNEKKQINKNLYSKIINKSNYIFYKNTKYRFKTNFGKTTFNLDEIKEFYKKNYSIDKWILIIVGNADEFKKYIQANQYDDMSHLQITPSNVFKDNFSKSFEIEEEEEYFSYVQSIGNIQNPYLYMNFLRYLLVSSFSSPFYKYFAEQKKLTYHILFHDNYLMEDNSFLIAFYVGSSKEYSIPKFEEDIEKIFLENFKINDNYLKARELLNTRLYLIKENGGKFSRLITQEIILRNKILDIDKCINYINSDSFITNCEMLIKNIFNMERIFIHSKSR